MSEIRVTGQDIDAVLNCYDKLVEPKYKCGVKPPKCTVGDYLLTKDSYTPIDTYCEGLNDEKPGVHTSSYDDGSFTR